VSAPLCCRNVSLCPRCARFVAAFFFVVLFICLFFFWVWVRRAFFSFSPLVPPPCFLGARLIRFGFKQDGGWVWGLAKFVFLFAVVAGW